MSRRALYAHLTFSLLGVVLGFSSSAVFCGVYHNYTAGVWAVLSGLFAGICLQLHYLVYRGRLEQYYTHESLYDLHGLGAAVSIISSGFFVWYIFATFYWHIPIIPIGENSVIPAVWAFITAKWGAGLLWASRHYRISMELGLLTETTDNLP